ncbi:MAG TPA: RagB/SusD family nutrient uptake outer membrane protein, partial [Chitinophaga sp.]
MVLYGIRLQAIYPYGLGWGGGTVNAKLWKAYAPGDTRRSAGIISIDDEKLDFQNRKDQREYTGYYMKKYTPMADSAGKSLAEKMGGTSFMISQYQDYVSIRYADVLLMAAELGSPKAQQYFDAVRQRAYGSGFTQIPVSPSNMLNERRLEFAGEGIRYWDLLRQGINVAAAAIAESSTIESGGANVAKTIAASRIIETQGLS